MVGYGPVWLAYVTVLAVTVLVQVAVGYWVYHRRLDRRGARWFIVMVGTGALWVLPMLVTFLVPVDAVQRFAFVLGSLGSMLTISAFVAFVASFTGADFHRNRAVQALLVGLPVTFAVLAVTDGAHGLMVTDYYEVTDPFPYGGIERGVAFELLILAIQPPALYAIYRMATHLLEPPRRAIRQAVLFVVGPMAIVALEYADHVTTALPATGFTHATLGMFVFYLCTAVALFRFDLFDVRSIVQDTVVEALRDPVFVVDGRGLVVYRNEAAAVVCDTETQTLPAPFEAVCPVVAAGLDGQWTDADGSGLTIEMDDGRRHFSVTASEVAETADGSAWHSLLLRDVTELEESRKHLTAQNERLDEVASTISHDLRNPLTVAMGHLEMLGDELEREELLEHVDVVGESHDRMLEIIEDILTVAREGQTVETVERVELEAVARDAWGHVDTTTASLTVVDSRSLHADRSKLLTILENLFRNAVDHGPDGVVVEVGIVDDGFYVRDDGPGIPDDRVAEIFEFGYSTDPDGTGLGLSIVRTMADAHGWQVALDAEAGPGAHFVVTGVDDTPDAATEREVLGTRR